MNNPIDLLLEYVDRFRDRGAATTPPASRRIAMLHIGRCGSSVLARQLEKHRTIHWTRESQAPPAKPEACELEPLKAAVVIR